MCKRTALDVILRNAVHFLRDRVFHWAGVHQLGQIVWPEIPRDPPASTSPMLGLQEHALIFGSED